MVCKVRNIYSMMTKARRVLGMALVLVISSTLFVLSADAQRITAKGPSHVAAGQQFQIQYVVNTQDVKGFRIGNVPDAFEVVYGPSTSTQQSFSMVNGRTSQSSSITYTYVLVAKKNGTFVIPSAHAVVSGSNVSSQALRINVSGTASSSAYHGSQQQRPQQRVDRAGARISGNDLFIRVTANKKSVYEQEPILLTYKVYTQVELTQLEGKMPDLNGFHTQEIPLPQQKSFHVETINGKPYNCVTWSQYVMYPQMSGKLEIPSLTFKGIVVQENPNVDPFEAFFNGGSGYIEVKKEIRAPGMTIQVTPLPTKPAGFSGGVGRYSITSSLDRSTVKAGDPVSLRIVVSGTGNMKLLKQPEVNLPKDFDKYDPKITDKTKLTAEGVTGSMVYDMLIVPRNKGKYTIPGVEFIYFDTQSASYKTIKTQPMDLTVEQGSGSNGGGADYSNANDNDISDIMMGVVSKDNPTDTFFGSTAYTIANGAILLIFIVLLIVFRKRAMALADVTAMRGKKANKVAVKRLRKASSLMKVGKQGEFYDEVLRALWGYVGDKLNIPVEQLSRDNISEKLQQRSVADNVVTSFIESIDECEYARFAPASGNDDVKTRMQATYDKATDAITKIEDFMKISAKAKTSSDAKTGVMSFVLTLLLSGLTATAMADNDMKASADAAYRSGDYQKAIELYEKDLSVGVSAEEYHNLGNAYYRSGNIYKAVLNYERARKLAPANTKIQHSLEIARNKTIDRMPNDAGMFFTQWCKAFVNSMTIDTWAYMAMVSLIVALLLFLVYLFVDNMLVRRISFYGSLLLFVLFVVGNVSALLRSHWLNTHDSAVVMNEMVMVKSSPTHKSSDAFMIHEGTTVHITDRDMNGWYGISLSDGREGWIESKEVEEI